MTYSKLCDVKHYVSLQNADINLTLKFKEILFLTRDSCCCASYDISEHKLPCSAGTKSSEKRYRWKATMTFAIGIIQAHLLYYADTDVSVGHAASIYTTENNCN